MTAVIGMGVLIAVGATVLVVLLVQRMSSAAAPNASTIATAPATITANAAEAMLDEPAGTHIAWSSLAGERLAVQLTGGGPDRIFIVDTRSGRVMARVSLAH